MAQRSRLLRRAAVLLLLIFGIACFRIPIEAALFGTRHVQLETEFPNVMMVEPDWPTSVEQAVKLLASEMTEKDKIAFSLLRHRDMSSYHFGFGTYIRNRFGLWRGNDELLKSTGCKHPDDASSVILMELNSHLRREL